MTRIRDEIDGLARAWELRRRPISSRHAASLLRTVLATPDEQIPAGHVQCPECHQEIPLFAGLVLDDLGELSATVDVSEVWSHAWVSHPEVTP